MRPLLLAIGVALCTPITATAQDFVPFDTGASEPGATPESKGDDGSGAGAEPKGDEASTSGKEGGSEEFVPPSGAAAEGSKEAPAGAGPAGASEESEAPATSGQASEGEDAGRRVVGEEVVEEKTEPIGASALAPATRGHHTTDRSNHRPSPTFAGSIGLARLRTAEVGPKGSVRLAMTGEFFALDQFLVVGDHESRQAMTLALGFTPTEWLEAYASLAYASSTNTLSSPTLLQVQGDTALGLKGVYQATDGLSLGLDLEVGLFPPIGKVGVGAAGFSPRALLTYDLRPALPSVPLLLHLELGLKLDGTGSLPGDLHLSRVEEFALGIHRYHRFLAGLGVEAPLPWVTPFVAWRLRAPLGQVDLPQVNDAGTLRTVTYGEVVAQHLVLGLRVTALRDLSFLATLEIGLSGAAIPGIPATMPWNLMLGLSYTLDPLSRSERVTRVVRRTVEVDRPVETRPPAGVVEGVVRDAASSEPIAGALITVEGSAEPPVASAPDTGKYRSRDLPPGEVRLTAMRDGYAPQTLPAVVADGATTPLDFSLKKLILTGTLTLVVTDTKTKKGLPAQIEIEGPEKKSLVAGADGKLEVELKPGDYRVTITHPKHNARQKDLTIENGAKVLADIELSPKIRRKLVILRKHKLQLKRKVHFQTGKAEILPDSYQLLDQVIDTIVSNHIEKIRVEGHTDSRGSDAANLRLSQARAEAVRTYLVERGISPDRIEAKGYGETRPIAPNLTKRGRAMNRRVEFHIVER